MKQLDPDKIFTLFDVQDQEVYEQYDMEDVLDNPFVLMGMVVTGVGNYQMLDIIYQGKYPNEYKKVRERFKHKFYNRLFTTLNRIQTDRFETVYTISASFESDLVYDSLYTLLEYFESIEEYEKCKVIKDYLDLLLDKNLQFIYKDR